MAKRCILSVKAEFPEDRFEIVQVAVLQRHLTSSFGETLNRKGGLRAFQPESQHVQSLFFIFAKLNRSNGSVFFGLGTPTAILHKVFQSPDTELFCGSLFCQCDLSVRRITALDP